MNEREEEFKNVWLQAWVAVAGCATADIGSCKRYAEACLAQYKEQFPE